MSELKRSGRHGETLNSDDVYELSASDESEPEDPPNTSPFDPELDGSDDDKEAEVRAPAAAGAARSSFVLTGGGSAFSNRSHSIFDCLDSVERRASSSLSRAGVTENQKPGLPPPAGPAPAKKRGVPDYLVHPERWTLYSLEDVPESSDKDNRRAAHQFLSSLQREKESDSPRDPQQKMIFSRPKRAAKEPPAGQLSPDQQDREKGLHLSHLADEEEEEEKMKKEEEEEEEGGREREKAGGRRRRKKEKDGEKDGSAAVCLPEKRKETADQKKTEEFVSFKKMKGKNYRKSSECEED